MEQFHEESIAKIDKGLNSIIYVIANVLMYLLGLIALVFLNAMIGGISQGKLNLPSTIIFFFFVFLTIGAYVLRNNQNIEYDYTYTNGMLDIAKIVNGAKRVKLISTDVNKFLAVGPVASDSFQRALKDPSIRKKYNYFLNKQKDLYYIIFVHKEVKSLLVMEPSPQMLNIFKALNPNSFRNS